MNSNKTNNEEDNLRTKTKLLSASIAQENYLQGAANKKDSKTLETLDNEIRNEYMAKINQIYLENEKQRELENHNRKIDYRDFLLNQIHEKEMSKQKVSHSPIKTTPFCEAYNDPVEKNKMKVMKQRETKTALDECVKQKNDFKLKSQLQELEEDKKRNDVLKQQDNVSQEFNQILKNRLEMREQRRNLIAELWTNKNKSVEQDRLISNGDSVEENYTSIIENETELLEMHKKIELRKDLLEQMKQKVDHAYKKLEDDVKQYEELEIEIEKEKDDFKALLERKKKEKEIYNKTLLNMMQEKEEQKKKDIQASRKEDNELMHKNKLNSDFFNGSNTSAKAVKVEEPPTHLNSKFY